ncbi:MAG: helix-turn-helix transcriptional regulator [Frankiaceae bacterium]|jgi:transcriptional regulator with XRE-family HTH domain|nr:helix-turn-helix transcriptional regulator [Frankiaceae bacterium]
MPHRARSSTTPGGSVPEDDHRWPNQRLYAIFAARDYAQLARLAKASGVSEDVLAAWLNNETPNPRRGTVSAVADVLAVPYAELRAAITSTPSAGQAVIGLWPAQEQIPAHLWADLIDSATQRLWLLDDTYACLLTACPDLADRLNAKADTGLDVRVFMADPHSPAITQRGQQTGEGQPLSHDAQRARRALGVLAGHDPARLGVHRLALPAALYIADDQFWIIHQIHGIPSGQLPVYLYSAEEQREITKKSQLPIWDTAIKP